MSAHALEALGGTADYRPTVVYLPQPAVGTDATWNIDGAEYYDLLAVSFTLATSAVVANRTPVLEITDGTGRVIVGACAGQAITATSTGRYTYAKGLSEWDFAGTAFASGPLPQVPLVMGEAKAVVIHVDALDVGDQLSAIAIVAGQVSIRPDDR